ACRSGIVLACSPLWGGLRLGIEVERGQRYRKPVRDLLPEPKFLARLRGQERRHRRTCDGALIYAANVVAVKTSSGANIYLRRVDRREDQAPLWLEQVLVRVTRIRSGITALIVFLSYAQHAS